MVTVVPAGPEVGVKLDIEGGFTTAKLLALVAVPAGVLTLIGPLAAPGGTVACIAVLDVILKLAATPLKVTAVAPVKLVPLMVTVVPAGPEPGEKLVMAGGLTTAKLLALDAVPPAALTLMSPVVADDGTVA
jgi:hypothetical protein